jgi:predicted permease
MIERLRTDTVAAIRALAASPWTVATAVLTLAIAVGLNLAMFGLIDRALLSPPPHVADPGSVYTLGFELMSDEQRGGRMTTTSYVIFNAIREHVTAVSGVAASQRTVTSVVINGEQSQVDAMLVSGSYFPVLGARAQLGRAIEDADDRVFADAPAVLSHAFWANAFGSNPGVIGRRISIKGTDYVVAGVMPAGFNGHSAARVDLWVPFYAAMQNNPGWDRRAFMNVASVLVRVAAGQTASAAATQATAATALTASSRRVSLTPIAGAAVAQAESRIAYWLAGVSMLVLVIGLANTATLLLARGARRRRDFAIRATLGASRGRLISEVLVEAVILSLVAVSVALVTAYWFDESVRRVLLPSLMENPGLNLRTSSAAVLAGLLALIVGTAVGVTQLPAQLRAEDLAGTARGKARRKTYAALLLVQTTLSVVLLAGAGLFGRSLYNLLAQDFGMQMDDVILVEFERGPGAGVNTSELLASAIDPIRSLPGVELVTPIQSLPFAGFHVPPMRVPGMEKPPSANGQLPFLIAATPELLEILRLEFVEGRRFTAADEAGPPVLIVNQALAQAIAPGQSAIGKCFRIGYDPSFDPQFSPGPPTPPLSLPCREIVGVVRNVRQRSLVPTGAEDRLMQYFVPYSQVPAPPGFTGAKEREVWGLLVRASASAESLASPIRKLVVGGRTDVGFLTVRPYTQLLDRQIRPWRLGSILLALFGALALGTAAIGLYAAFAHSVEQRRREMAIRIAIGARPSRVLIMILRESVALAVGGVLCGAATAFIVSRWVQSMLFGIAPTDPAVLAAAACVMVVVAAVATYLPARTAARTDPNSLLRAE